MTAFTASLPAGAEVFVIATGFLDGKLPREPDGFALLAVGPTGTVGFIRQNPVVFALHGSPDAPPVDIFAGATELASDLGFGEISGAIQVPPGSYTLDFKDQGGNTAATRTTPNLAAGERYLAMANGFVTPENNASAFELLAFVDAFDPMYGGPLLNVIHGSADAPAVDIGTASGNVVSPIGDFTNLSYKGRSLSTGTSVPEQTLSVGVAAAGTTNALVTFTVPVTASTKAFAIAAGSFLGDGQSFRLLAVDTGAFPWSVATILPD